MSKFTLSEEQISTLEKKIAELSNLLQENGYDDEAQDVLAALIEYLNGQICELE